MACVRIIFSGVSSANRKLKEALREFAALEDAYVYLSKCVDPDIQARYQIAERLRNSRRTVSETCRAAGSILKIAGDGALEYRRAESRLERAVHLSGDNLRSR